MTDEQKQRRELDPPPIAKSNPHAFEVLRVWGVPHGPQQLTFQTSFEDPGEWGTLIVDLMRRLAHGYEQIGNDPDETLRKIRRAFESEWSNPDVEPRPPFTEHELDRYQAIWMSERDGEYPLSRLDWLGGYSGQSTDELIALEGKYRTDSIVLAFEEAIMNKAATLGDGALSDEERTVLAVEAVEREVCNGGYDQFFLNTPEYSSAMVGAFERIGCSIIAAISAKALEILTRLPDECEQRTHELDECDEKYFAHSGSIAAELFEYIKNQSSNILTH